MNLQTKPRDYSERAKITKRCENNSASCTPERKKPAPGSYDTIRVSARMGSDSMGRRTADQRQRLDLTHRRTAKGGHRGLETMPEKSLRGPKLRAAPRGPSVALGAPAF